MQTLSRFTVITYGNSSLFTFLLPTPLPKAASGLGFIALIEIAVGKGEKDEIGFMALTIAELKRGIIFIDSCARMLLQDMQGERKSTAFLKRNLKKK